MSWGKVLFGFVIIMGVFIAWFRIMKSINGGGGSGVDMRVGRGRRKDDAINELEQIIAAHRSGAAPASTPVPVESAAAIPASPVAMVRAPAPPVPERPPALLSGASKLAYLLFKSAAPDHHVFARVPIGEVLPAAARDGDLGSHVVTLVLCRSDFSVATVVDIAEPDSASHVARLKPMLQSASIRHIVLDPRRMPKPRDVRALLDAP